MDKMNVITFLKTGHVLGVVTRASQPETAVTVEQVVVGGFRLRSFDDATGRSIVLEIPEDEIGAALVDFDTRVLYRPHLFSLENGQPEEKNTTLPTLSINLVTNEVTVTLPAPVTSSIDLWCQISGGNLVESIVRSITIPGTALVPTATGTESLTLGAGDYQVAIFAPDYALALSVISI